MKRLAAILLLGIFAFNLFGYRIVASFLENKADKQIELALDQAKYNDDELISIKQPTNLPYYQNSKDFQRIDGEIEISGVLYKYVKCRIYNDSLELMCIPNNSKMQIQAAKADFSKLAGDVQQSTEKKKAADSKSFHKTLSEFEEAQLMNNNSFSVSLHTNHRLQNQVAANSFFLQSPEQPPDMA